VSLLDDLVNATTKAGPPEGRYGFTMVVVIAITAGALSLVTVIGNSMVMISFKIDKQLQTISNYFLFRYATLYYYFSRNARPLRKSAQ